MSEKSPNKNSKGTLDGEVKVLVAEQADVRLPGESFKVYWATLWGVADRPTKITVATKPPHKKFKVKLEITVAETTSCDKAALKTQNTQTITGYSLVLKRGNGSEPEQMYIIASEKEEVVDKFYLPLSRVIQKRHDGPKTVRLAPERRLSSQDRRSSNASSPKRGKSVSLPKAAKPVGALNPTNLNACMDWLFAHGGLLVEGICRVSGSATAMGIIAGELSIDGFDISCLDGCDCHTVVGAVKRNLRELTPSLIDAAMYKELAAGLANNALPSRRILACRKLLMQTSPGVQSVIRNIATFALLVEARRAETLMTFENLAITWGPTVFHSPSSGQSIADTGTGLSAMKTLLDFYGYIWDEVPDDSPDRTYASVREVKFKSFTRGDPDADQVTALLAASEIQPLKMPAGGDEDDELARMLNGVDSVSLSDSDSSALDLEAE